MDLYEAVDKLRALSADVRDDPFRLAARTEMFELLDFVLTQLEAQRGKEEHDQRR